MTEQRGADARSPVRSALPRIRSGVVKRTDEEELEEVDELEEVEPARASEAPTLPPPPLVVADKDGDMKVYRQVVKARPRSRPESPASGAQRVMIEEVVADLRRDPRSEK